MCYPSYFEGIQELPDFHETRSGYLLDLGIKGMLWGIPIYISNEVVDFALRSKMESD